MTERLEIQRSGAVSTAINVILERRGYVVIHPTGATITPKGEAAAEALVERIPAIGDPPVPSKDGWGDCWLILARGVLGMIEVQCGRHDLEGNLLRLMRGELEFGFGLVVRA